ncbi:MAG: MFS transporter [Rhodospirillaceae bacterium]|jgi:MFS family permease
MTSSDSSSPLPKQQDGPFALLVDGPYFRVWFAGALANAMRWLEMLAVGVYVYDKTQSPFLVALVLFCRQLPQVLFGAVLGSIADKINKKTLFIIGLITVTIVSTVLGVLLVTGKAEIWHLALGAVISGFLMAMDFPVRRNMLGEICGMDRISAGMALDASTTNITRMIGPVTGGILLEFIGLYSAFFLGAALHAIALLLIITLPYRSGTTVKQKTSDNKKISVTADIIEAIRFVRQDQVIFAMLAITLALNMLAMPFNSMIPVIGRDELNLNAIHVGILASAEALGAFIGCILIAYWRTERFTQIFLFGSAIYLAFLFFFSFSGWYVLSLSLLFLSGLGHSGFSVGQSTLAFTRPTPEIRGRIMGVLSMTIGIQPLGILHVGLLAEYFGGSTAVMIMTAEGLIALLVCWYLWPDMQRDNKSTK